MSSRFGQYFRMQLFGESHGSAVGIVIEGIPPGLAIDHEALAFDMARRRPGQSGIVSPRRESDAYRVVSGEHDGRATGTPYTALIPNSDVKRSDNRAVPRPGHADYTAQLRYGGHADISGGGHLSGRLTAPLTLAGGIAKQMLALRGVAIGCRITRIGTVKDDQPFAWSPDVIRQLSGLAFPVANPDISAAMQREIQTAQSQDDSVGGELEVCACGLPAGIGSPIFRAADAILSQICFGIPGVKSVSFGSGAALAGMRGTLANDAFCVQNGRVGTQTNHCGGILGGITNGMPLIMRLTFKPTPSIAAGQPSVNLDTLTEQQIKHSGRNDPCIALRAVPVAKAAVAAALVDLWAEIQPWEAL